MGKRMRRFLIDKAFVADASIPVVALAILIWIKPDAGSETVDKTINFLMIAAMGLAFVYQIGNVKALFSPCQKYASTLLSVGDEVTFLWHPPGKPDTAVSRREGQIISTTGSQDASHYRLDDKQPWERRTVDIESRDKTYSVPITYVDLK